MSQHSFPPASAHLPTPGPLTDLHVLLERPAPFLAAMAAVVLLGHHVVAGTESPFVAFVLLNMASVAGVCVLWTFMAARARTWAQRAYAALAVVGFVVVVAADGLLPGYTFSLAAMGGVGAAYGAMRLIHATHGTRPAVLWVPGVLMATILASVQPFGMGRFYGAYLVENRGAMERAIDVLPQALDGLRANLRTPSADGRNPIHTTTLDANGLVWTDPLVGLAMVPHFLGTASMAGWETAEARWTFHPRGQRTAVITNYGQNEHARAAIQKIHASIQAQPSGEGAAARVDEALRMKTMQDAYHAGHPMISMVLCNTLPDDSLGSVTLMVQRDTFQLVDLWAKDVPSWLGDACKGWAP